jgi:hypothetical protein
MVAALESHIEAAQRKIRRRRQAAMSGSQHRNRLYRHTVPPD